jgi:hypothetical protein
VSGWTGGGDVSVTWRDSGGTIKAQGVVTDRVTRWFEFCPSDSRLAVVPGDLIKISSDFASRNWVVPNLSIDVDRVSNLAIGTAPAGRTIRLCSSWYWYAFPDSCHSVRVGQNGTWTYDPHTDLFGGVDAYIFWKSPKGDRLYVDSVVPFLRVTIGHAAFKGFAQPFASVDVSLDGATDATGHAVADSSGAFEGTFRDAGGHAVSVAPTDHISAPSLESDADWVVPTISGSANKLTEVVRGACSNSLGNHQVRIAIVGPLGTVRGQGFWHTNSEGKFKATFVNYFAGGDTPTTTNIKSGDTVSIDCMQATGDFSRWSFLVP